MTAHYTKPNVELGFTPCYTSCAGRELSMDAIAHSNMERLRGQQRAPEKVVPYDTILAAHRALVVPPAAPLAALVKPKPVRVLGEEGGLDVVSIPGIDLEALYERFDAGLI